MSNEEHDVIHPKITGTVSFSIEDEWPHVDLVMPSGRRVVGYVVADQLKDRLPSFFDGVQMWSNPLLPPEEKP